MTQFSTIYHIWNSCFWEMKRAVRGKIYRKILKKRPPKNFQGYGKNVLNGNKGNNELAKMILGGEPFCAARLGTSESNVLKRFLAKKAHISRSVREKEIQILHNCSGFFPPQESAIEEYAQMILDFMPEIDLYACWNTSMEHYYVRNCLKRNANLAHFHFLEPYYHDLPWSIALEGKKILVIHPFAKSIEMQYQQKREVLFKQKDILPAFKLKTIKAVQSIAGSQCEFLTWFDALEHMYQQAMSIDFDIAILGCGAYAFPLACKLKRSGRSAITMCGSTQILFGIRGKRWDIHPVISKLYNSEWVTAMPEETPTEFQKVEGGCYW